MDQSLLFFSLALLAPLGYSLNSVLLAKYSRQMDGLTLATYRNLSFIVTLLPLLYFSGSEGIFQTLEQWPFLVAAAISGVGALSLALASQQYLPMGIVSAFVQLSSPLVVLWTFLYSGDIPNIFTFLFLMLIFVGGFFLAIQKHHLPHLNKQTEIGLLFVSISIIFGSGTFFFMSIAAQNAHPLAAGYFWEILIGIFALLALFIRAGIQKKMPKLLPKKDIFKITLFTLPTLIGSSALPIAMTLGNPGIAHSLTTAGGVIITTLLSTFIHQEKLRIMQILPMGIVILGVVGMKTFG